MSLKEMYGPASRAAAVGSRSELFNSIGELRHRSSTMQLDYCALPSSGSRSRRPTFSDQDSRQTPILRTRLHLLPGTTSYGLSGSDLSGFIGQSMPLINRTGLRQSMQKGEKETLHVKPKFHRVQARRAIWVTRHLRPTERRRRHRSSSSSLGQTLLTGPERG